MKLATSATIVVLAILVQAPRSSQAEDEAPALWHTINGQSHWLEDSGTEPAQMPGPQSGYWSVSLTLPRDEEHAETERVSTVVVNGRPGVGYGFWKSGRDYLLDEAGRPLIDYVLWAIPEELADEFLQYGHLDLPGFMDQSARDTLDVLGIPTPPQLPPLEQRAMFAEMLPQLRELSLDGLHLFFVSTRASRAELKLDWEDIQVPGKPVVERDGRLFRSAQLSLDFPEAGTR